MVKHDSTACYIETLYYLHKHFWTSEYAWYRACEDTRLFDSLRHSLPYNSRYVKAV